MSTFVIPAILILLCTCDAFVAFSSSPTGRLASRQIYLQPSHNIAANFLLRAAEGNLEDAEVEIDLATIPTYLPSERGIDYVPFATMLAVGDFKGADQFTRDNLIKISGPGSVKRQFVYWTEVKNLPATDLATMERLWLQFSGGNFGYSVQKRVWDVENANFDNYIRRIGWTTIDNGNERKLKWFGQSEFIYDVEKAPKGHLPLTSALRGTQLMKELMNHPVWVQYDWRNYKDLKWGP
jgi:GUN4-like